MKQGKDFIINEFGEVVSLNGNSVAPKETPERKLQSERSQLEYEIFSHPERMTPDELAAKKARFEELNNILGIKKIDTLAAGKDMLKKRLAAMNMAARAKEND